ncbi:MAG: recombinase family protein [Planctomycetota bacterium]
MDNIAENERPVGSGSSDAGLPAARPTQAGENIVPSKSPPQKPVFPFSGSIGASPVLPASGKIGGEISPVIPAKLFHPWQARLQSGKKEGALAGRHQGGMTPFGYRRDYDPLQKRFVLKINPAEAPVVRYIFDGYLKLKSLEKLAVKLESTNVRTRHGNLWSRPALGFLLANEIYLGKIKYGEIKTRGQHQPMIAPVIFNLAQKLKKVNRKNNRV